MVQKPSPRKDKTEGSCARASLGVRVGRSSCDACRFKRVIEMAVRGGWQRFSLSVESDEREREANKSREIVVALFKFWVVASVASVGNKCHMGQRSNPRHSSSRLSACRWPFSKSQPSKQKDGG
jgi:hypothetical protein